MVIPSEGGPARNDSPGSATGQARWEAFDAARSQWPLLTVNFEEFCAHLDRLGHQDLLPDHLGPLYLCIACARGCDLACRAIEGRYFGMLRAFIARFDRRPEVLDDLMQQIRCRLLVGPAPRIGTYCGRGSFEGWLRQVARTVALDSIRVNVALDQRLARLRDEATGAELVHAKETPSPDQNICQDHVLDLIQRVLSDSLRRLPNDQRQILHHYYVYGLTVDQLAVIYRCNRSTAARRVARTVKLVQESMRRELSRHFGVVGKAELAEWGPIYRRWEMADVAPALAAP